MTWVQNGRDLYESVNRVLEDPREILHSLKAVQDDAGENPGIDVILNPGFSRVKDLAWIGTGSQTQPEFSKLPGTTRRSRAGRKNLRVS